MSSKGLVEIVNLFMLESDEIALKKMYQLTNDKLVYILLEWKKEFDYSEAYTNYMDKMYEDIMGYVWEKYKLNEIAEEIKKQKDTIEKSEERSYFGIYYTLCDDVGKNEGGYFVELYSDENHDDRIDWMVLHKDTDEVTEPDKYIKEYIKEELKDYIHNKRMLNMKENAEILFNLVCRQRSGLTINSKQIQLLKEKNIINDNHNEKDLENVLDSILEKLWCELEDIPFEQKYGTEILSSDYLDFRVGDTTKDDIWAWFNSMHSKGIDYLVEEYEIQQDTELEEEV